MSAPTVGPEAVRYLNRVRAALADVAPDERDELVDDLAAHLADLSAEPGGSSLTERLGEPEEYAAELRASAGLAQVRPAGDIGARLRAAGREMRAAADRLPGAPRILGFLPELRPGWWVLRGYLLAAVPLGIIFGTNGPFPDGEGVLALIILLPFTIWASVRLGRQTPDLRRPARWAIGAGGIVLALCGLVLITDSAGDGGAVYDDGGTLGYVTDLRVYDSNGELLHQVQIFDQNGQPVEVDSGCGQPNRMRADGSTATNVYPRQADDPACADYTVYGGAPLPQRLAPLLPTAVSPSPSVSTSASASVTPTPTPVKTPGPKPSVTPTAAPKTVTPAPTR
jgi:hypothetical protein